MFILRSKLKPGLWRGEGAASALLYVWVRVDDEDRAFAGLRSETSGHPHFGWAKKK